MNVCSLMKGRHPLAAPPLTEREAWSKGGAERSVAKTIPSLFGFREHRLTQAGTKARGGAD
jgi:hypothetical protein